MTQEYLRRRRKQVTEVAHELVDHDAGDAPGGAEDLDVPQREVGGPAPPVL